MGRNQHQAGSELARISARKIRRKARSRGTHMTRSSLPNFSRRLRITRRARSLKQSHVARLAGVCQTTVSRWEAGLIEPEPHVAARILSELAWTYELDAPIRRLVERCSLACHLIADVDHRLLAASPARLAQWGRNAPKYFGQSLWPFATPDIIAAERSLAEQRWWSELSPEPVEVFTGASNSSELRIVAGRMIWERVWLSDGRAARLCSSME